MTARQFDAGALLCANRTDHIRPNKRVVRELLARNLFALGKDGLVVPHLHRNDVWITGLLHATGNNSSGLVREFAQNLGILGLTQTLHDHRAGYRSSDTPKARGRVIKFPDGVSILVLFGGHHNDVTMLVDFDSGFWKSTRNVVVGL